MGTACTVLRPQELMRRRPTLVPRPWLLASACGKRRSRCLFAARDLAPVAVYFQATPTAAAHLAPWRTCCRRIRIVIEEVVLQKYRWIFVASLFLALLSPSQARDQDSAIEAGKAFLESLRTGHYDRYVLHAPPGWKNNVGPRLTYEPEMFEHWRRQINKLESGKGKITTLYFVPDPEMKDMGYVGFQYGAERDRRGLSLLFTEGKWCVLQVGAELPHARGLPSQ